jgi:predicted MFS family arabinose efflux permease
VTLQQLRKAGFFRLWIAETASLAGSQVTLFALPLVAVLLLHATPWQMGVLAAAGSSATLCFGLSAGVVADRYERIRLMQVCNASRIVLIGVVPVLYLMGSMNLWALVVVAFAVAAVTLVYDSARAAVVPNLVERGSLTVANSWMQGSVAVADVAGPGLAGLLVQTIGAPLALVADACSYLIGALALRKTPAVHPPRTDARERHGAAVKRGLSYLWRDNVQRPLALAAGHYNIFHAMFFAGFTLYALRVLHFSVFELGLIGVLTGIAGLIAVAASYPIATRFGYGRTLALVYLLPGAAAIIVPLAPASNRLVSLVLVGFSQFSWTVIVVINLVVSESVKQARTPDVLLGRVTSSLHFVASGADPIGALIGGALGSSILGLRGTLFIAACGLVTSVSWPLAEHVRAIRTLDDLVPLPDYEPSSIDSETSKEQRAAD